MTAAKTGPLSKGETRAFLRLAVKYRKGRLPERDREVFFALRERVRADMPKVQS